MLIDNKKNHKLGEVLKENIESNCKLSIISGYFTLYGFSHLKTELEKVNTNELLEITIKTNEIPIANPVLESFKRGQ